jgi:hypothetical protein
MKQAGAAADPFAKYRDGYAQQLQALMANPSSITNTPGYGATMAAGEQTLTRNLASQGLTGSGAAAEALTNFGGQFQNQAYKEQVGTLSNLGGAGINNAGLSLSALASGNSAQNGGLNNLVKILPALMNQGGG